MNTTIIDTVRKRLTESIDAKVLATSAHFFKEGEQAKVYGVRMGEVSGIAKESWQEVKGESKPDIFQLCEQLWQFDFVTKHCSAMPRTAYRYALEKMPKDMRAEAMKK